MQDFGAWCVVVMIMTSELKWDPNMFTVNASQNVVAAMNNVAVVLPEVCLAVAVVSMAFVFAYTGNKNKGGGEK